MLFWLYDIDDKNIFLYCKCKKLNKKSKKIYTIERSYIQANAELVRESRMLSDRVNDLTKSCQETRMLLGEKEESCGMLAGKECSLTSYFIHF